MPDLRYLVVVKYPSGHLDKTYPICASMRDAVGLCATVKQRVADARFIILRAESDNAVESLYQRLREGELFDAPQPAEELMRHTLEDGPGGDHDTPYTFALPAYFPVAAAWTRLCARLSRGEIGGAHDGAECAASIAS